MMQAPCPDESYVLELYELEYSPARIAREMDWSQAAVEDVLGRYIDEFLEATTSGCITQYGSQALASAVQETGGHQ